MFLTWVLKYQGMELRHLAKIICMIFQVQLQTITKACCRPDLVHILYLAVAEGSWSQGLWPPDWSCSYAYLHWKASEACVKRQGKREGGTLRTLLLYSDLVVFHSNSFPSPFPLPTPRSMKKNRNFLLQALSAVKQFSMSVLIHLSLTGALPWEKKMERWGSGHFFWFNFLLILSQSVAKSFTVASNLSVLISYSDTWQFSFLQFR